MVPCRSVGGSPNGLRTIKPHTETRELNITPFSHHIQAHIGLYPGRGGSKPVFADTCSGPAERVVQAKRSAPPDEPDESDETVDRVRLVTDLVDFILVVQENVRAQK